MLCTDIFTVLPIILVATRFKMQNKGNITIKKNLYIQNTVNSVSYFKTLQTTLKFSH